MPSQYEVERVASDPAAAAREIERLEGVVAWHRGRWREAGEALARGLDRFEGGAAVLLGQPGHGVAAPLLQTLREGLEAARRYVAESLKEPGS